VAADTLAR